MGSSDVGYRHPEGDLTRIEIFYHSWGWSLKAALYWFAMTLALRGYGQPNHHSKMPPPAWRSNWALQLCGSSILAFTVLLLCAIHALSHFSMMTYLTMFGFCWPVWPFISSLNSDVHFSFNEGLIYGIVMAEHQFWPGFTLLTNRPIGK